MENLSFTTLLVALFLIDLLGSIAGVFAMQVRNLHQQFLNLSGGVMLGIALFWIWPDMAEVNGTAVSFWVVTLTFIALFAFDRYVYSICPCCSQSICNSSSRAIAPLVAAIYVHNLFDGFLAGAAENVGTHSSSGIIFGLLAHKIPEAAVFGMMLRSNSKSTKSALGYVSLTATAILLGGFGDHLLATLNVANLVTALMSLACGSFLLLGLHTFTRQRRVSGVRPALLSIALGVACTIIVGQGSALVKFGTR